MPLQERCVKEEGLQFYTSGPDPRCPPSIAERVPSGDCSKMPKTLTDMVTDDLLKLLSGDASTAKLTKALRHLAKWRAHVLENALVERSGDAVLSGPFAGMVYPVRSAEGARDATADRELRAQPVSGDRSDHPPPLCRVIDIGLCRGLLCRGPCTRDARHPCSCP